MFKLDVHILQCLNCAWPWMIIGWPHTKLLSVMWIQNPRWSPLQYKVLTFDPMGK